MVFKARRGDEVTKEMPADRKRPTVGFGVLPCWGDEEEPAAEGEEGPVGKKMNQSQQKPHEGHSSRKKKGNWL